MKIGIVKAQYNKGITDKMLESAEKRAEELGAETKVVEVPGVYDTPLAADRLARKEEISAVTVLGAIIEGDTDHDKIIGETASQKLSEISLERDKPVTMGITGPGMTADEARERIDYASQAVESAANILENLSDLE